MVGKIIADRFIYFVVLAIALVTAAFMASGIWWLIKISMWHEHLDFIFMWKWTSIILVAVGFISVLIGILLDAYQALILAHKYGVNWGETFEAFVKYHFRSTGERVYYGAPEFRQWLKTQQSKS